MNKFIKYNYSVNDGNSSLRLANLIEGMIKNGNKRED